ncbi:HNH endonuclease [Lapillicoccus jejuensis]|uniref:5-methylcytosine-specific restriction endonuclease McrA n=1 Tax=Lapillicoccus jejuensis TaxID=402171 RepID=A0A542DYU4_9MICO|nr:HNH endonuclease [Lapillicoccus jejuensis]TQJ08270.1 5-methylcytosine-specific restriction endonuclease McrA [Lapillicoccus jejuensis]
MSQVLILNASYEPLGGVSVRHAIGMLVREVAVVEEAVEGQMFGPYPRPRVVRLLRYVAAKWLHRPAGWSKRAVLTRDRHRCAYCAGRATTVDHVVPMSRGGGSTWLNTVASCSPCNNRKGDRLLPETSLRLAWQPWVPRHADLLA